MPASKELEYRLRWMDFDRYGRLKPQSVLDIFQDIATIQARDMGIGDDVLLKKGIFWVITRQKLEFFGQPERLSTVIARTWPHTQTKLSFLRDYTLRDAQTGDIFVKATSEWVLMDVINRKFVSALEAYDGPQDFCEDRCFEAKPKKIKDFEASDEGLRIVPAYSDIDQNGHLNNAHYAKLIIDALNPSAEGQLKTIQIDYRHEVPADTPITLHFLKEEAAIKTKGLLDDGTTAFMSLVELA